MPEKPLWAVVYDDLRAQIEHGRLNPDDPVPPEETLATQHSVSRQTVRLALGRLQQDGLVSEGRGRLGRIVREYAPLRWNLHTFERGDRRDDPVLGVDEWKADMLDQGVQNPRLEVSVSLLPAPARIASILHVRAGELVLRRRRLRLADDLPVALADTWVREDIARMQVDGAAPLLAPEDVTLPGGIFKALGFTTTELDDEITVRMPTPEESGLLDLPMGSPVGQVDRTSLDSDGEPIRLLSTVFPGHRLKLHYRLGS
jgi:GntR family transcriptional regulator